MAKTDAIVLKNSLDFISSFIGYKWANTAML